MSQNSIAIFAAGCFWCTEPVFTQLKGVTKVISGYTGGHVENPSYEQICQGDTGHAEAIEIHFDAQQISYAQLLEIFLLCHDPTTLNRQGNDIGTQYRSAIFYFDEAQYLAAEAMIATFNAAYIYSAPIVTQLCAAQTFYAAEVYHQAYFAKNPTNPYCIAVAAPKKAKIRAKFAELMARLN